MGINSLLAITGDYTHNRLSTLSGVCLFGGSDCGQTVASRTLSEQMGGGIGIARPVSRG